MTDVNCNLCHGRAVAVYEIDDLNSLMGDTLTLCAACVFEQDLVFFRLGILVEDLTGGWWTRHYETGLDPFPEPV